MPQSTESQLEKPATAASGLSRFIPASLTSRRKVFFDSQPKLNAAQSGPPRRPWPSALCLIHGLQRLLVSLNSDVQEMQDVQQDAVCCVRFSIMDFVYQSGFEVDQEFTEASRFYILCLGSGLQRRPP